MATDRTLRIEVRSQVELDAALKRYDPTRDRIVCVGNGMFDISGSASVTASGSASVRAYDSASVTAYDSASVTASGSASVRASGSASVTASGSASVRAYDSASVTASGSARIIARQFCTIIVREQAASSVSVDGGNVVTIPAIRSAAEWCEFYGPKVSDGVATLYKAVRDDYRSAHGLLYAPGSTPTAPDWDGGKAECGGGLHFCASPHEAAGFDPEATRYLACPVRVADIAVHYPADYPQKVKAPGCCGPVVECDIDGRVIA